MEKTPPHVQAWLALSLPLLAWILQAVMVVLGFLLRGAPAEVYFLAAGVQGFLILAGLFFGIWALVKRGQGGKSIVVPAAIGLALCVGTLLLIGVLVLLSVLG